jgi:hypothetical protein
MSRGYRRAGRSSTPGSWLQALRAAHLRRLLSNQGAQFGHDFLFSLHSATSTKLPGNLSPSQTRERVRGNQYGSWASTSTLPVATRRQSSNCVPRSPSLPTTGGHTRGSGVRTRAPGGFPRWSLSCTLPSDCRGQGMRKSCRRSGVPMPTQGTEPLWHPIVNLCGGRERFENEEKLSLR